MNLDGMVKKIYGAALSGTLGLAGCPHSPVESPVQKHTAVTFFAEELKKEIGKCVAPNLQVKISEERGQRVQLKPGDETLSVEIKDTVKVDVLDFYKKSDPDMTTEDILEANENFARFCKNNADCTTFPKELLEDINLRVCVDNAIQSTWNKYDWGYYRTGNRCTVQQDFAYGNKACCGDPLARIIVICGLAQNSDEVFSRHIY